MLRQIEWWLQNGPITKNGVLPVTTSFFWKFCFSLRTSYKELIWCTNDPNAHIRTFCKRWSFIWRYFFPVSIVNVNRKHIKEILMAGKLNNLVLLLIKLIKDKLHENDKITLSRWGAFLKTICHLTILTGKTCVLLNSVKDWLLGYFWPFSYVYAIN